jgi:hypothetical protein
MMGLVDISAGVMEIMGFRMMPRSRARVSIKVQFTKPWHSCKLDITNGHGMRVVQRGFNCTCIHPIR